MWFFAFPEGFFLWCIGYIFAIFLPHLKFAEYPLRTDIVNNRWRVCEDIAQKKGVANTLVRKKIDTEGKYIMNTSGSKAHLNDFSCPIYYFYIICCRAVALQSYSYRSDYKRVFVGLWEDLKNGVKIQSRKSEGSIFVFCKSWLQTKWDAYFPIECSSASKRHHKTQNHTSMKIIFWFSMFS